MAVRPAIWDDLPALVEIYNHAITHTVATFDTVPVTVDDGSGLQLDLLAQRLDLDALDLVLPESEQDDGGAGPALRLRLSAEEVVRGGVTARGVVMSLGDDPDCRRPSG